MQLAFTLFNYFPYGGLERDMLAVAGACTARGHEVTIYTRSWSGKQPDLVRIREIPVSGHTNHARNLDFVRRLRPAIDSVAADSTLVGFNKMPGLDVYYAADVCFVEKASHRSFLYRLTPRYRAYAALEASVFGSASHTEIMLIAENQRGLFQRHYGTPNERLHLLAPGIRRDCVMPADYIQRRQQLRAQHGLSDDSRLLLFVGSDYQRKGLDRALRGLAQLPPAERERTQLWVVGKDVAAPFEKLAGSLGIGAQARFLGARDDVPSLMWSADALLHPAYSEAAGLVLLEAVVAGLPVVVSAVCGHAHYIREFDMGSVLEQPLTPATVADAISRTLACNHEYWRSRAQRVIDSADIFSMPERAADLIERAAKAKARRGIA